MDDNINTQIVKLPKRASTKPSIVAIVFLVIIVLALIPHTIALYTWKATVQVFLLIPLSPLVLPGLFCAYHTGLAIGKITYTKWHKEFQSSILALAIMQLVCIILCIVAEIILAGFPVQLCFDWCQKVELIDVFMAYLLFSTVLFLPAYYA
jgi:hypothetical protein